MAVPPRRQGRQSGPLDSEAERSRPNRFLEFSVSSQELFADGIGEITLVGGMVRIDWVSLSVTERDEQGQPSLEFRQRVVMPPEGFLRSFSAMEDLVKKLVDAGVIRRQESAPGSIGQESTAGRPRPASPNFSNG